jgi:hypothetical protein
MLVGPSAADIAHPLVNTSSGALVHKQHVYRCNYLQLFATFELAKRNI